MEDLLKQELKELTRELKRLRHDLHKAKEQKYNIEIEIILQKEIVQIQIKREEVIAKINELENEKKISNKPVKEKKIYGKGYHKDDLSFVNSFIIEWNKYRKIINEHYKKSKGKKHNTGNVRYRDSHCVIFK